MELRTQSAAPWTDVARLSRAKLVIRGLLFLAGAALFGGGLIAGVTKAREEGGVGPWFALLFGLFLFWWVLGAALLRLRVAVDGRVFLRASPQGIRMRFLPDTSTAFLRGTIPEIEIPWGEIRSCYPHIVRYGGLPATNRLVFETVTGPGLAIDLYPFRESAYEIVDRLKAVHP
jgi:hypothetical protein